MSTTSIKWEHRRARQADIIQKWLHLWTQHQALVFATLFVIVFSALMFCKHDAFNTRTYDFARFDQAIWNTLHGRFLFSSILNMSILGNHFSPAMALLSPLFLIWNNPKILFLVQTVSMAVTGLFLFQIVQIKHTSLAPWFLLAFYLNPAIHEITLFEFRREVPAMPFLALAMYALYTKKRWWMVAGLLLALLWKENIGFVVLMAGFYLIAFERDWKWGVPLFLLGSAWVIVVSVWVIPAQRPPSDSLSVYPQLYYFDFLGDSYGEIAQTLLHDPLILFRRLITLERLAALWQAFLPLGIILPWIAPDWVLMCLPTLAYMLMSDEPVMYQLKQWHLSTVMPVLFAAIGVGLGRLPARWTRWAVVALLVTTGLGYLLYSPAPLGGDYDASLYTVTEHHRLAARIVATVPSEATVAAQPMYVPHLSHREHIYHYPWIVIGEENLDYILLDRYSNPYPFKADALNAKINDMLADPSYTVQLEADGIYLFRKRPAMLSLAHILDNTIKLVSGDITVQDEHGIFAQPSRSPVQVQAGQQVRVMLLWEALEAPDAERTVSVRMLDATGQVVVQQDNWPGQGAKPTSWWQAGWQIRDVYYLTVPADAPTGPASLQVLVYDSYTQEVLLFDNGMDRIEIAQLQIVS